MPGTCFGKELRVTAIDGMSIDFQPSGDILFLNNPDTAGTSIHVLHEQVRGSLQLACVIRQFLAGFTHEDERETSHRGTVCGISRNANACLSLGRDTY